MRFNLETILDMSLEGQDVELFIELIGTIRDTVHTSRATPGFKDKNKFTLELQDDVIEFVEKTSEIIGIGEKQEEPPKK